MRQNIIMKWSFLFAIFLLFSYPAIAQNVYEKNGNIFLSDNKGNKTQLTFNGNNSSPILSPDSNFIAFVHKASGPAISTGGGDATPTELWIVNLSTKKAENILPPINKEDRRHVLPGITDVQFSNDSRTIFFLAAEWAVSNAVHKISLLTKKESLVAPGNTLEVIRNGKYKGNLKVNQHRYHKGDGSYDCDYILTPDGKEVTVLKDSCDPNE